MEPNRLEPGKVERGVGRARGDGARGARVVVGGRYRHDPVAVAVGDLEDGAGDVRPALHGAGAGAVVGAVGGVRPQHVEDGLRHVAREGQAAQLVVHDGDLLQLVLRVGYAVGQPLHGLHEVVALADDPAGAHDVVARAAGHGDVAGGLGLAVDGHRGERLVLRVDLGGAVEDVVGGHVDERDPVPGAGAGEQGRPGRVGLPGDGAALGGLGFIHGGVGAAVDHGAVERPVVLGVGRRVGHVEGVDVAEVEVLGHAALLGERAHRAAQLAVAAGDERPLGRHGDDVPQHRVVEVGLGDGGLLQRDGPLDGELGVGEVHEGVGPLELQRPVGVHQVGVGGAVLQGLEGVAHAARDVDGLGRVERAGEHLAEGLAALAQVHPGAEDRAAGHRDELIPGLRVDAAGDAPLLVVGDVVLDDAEVRDAQGGHLGALPVLLEPAARVAVDGEVDDLEALDAGLGDGEVLLECDVCHVGKAPIEEVGKPGSPRGAVHRDAVLLALRAVARLGGLLGRAPPGLVGDVPVDRLLEPLGEVGVGRPPAELALELGRVDGVAAVVAGAVGDPVEVLGVAPHRLQDHAQDRDVVLLAVGSDEVGLPHAALGEDVPDGRGVVLGVDPVADVLAAAVELGAHAVDDVRDLARDELLHVLVGAVVVGAVGDRGAQAVGAGPGADQHVGGRLGARVRAARVVRRLLGELRRVVERQVAVDLVGGDVVVADAVFADGLQQAEGALHVGAQEGLRVGDGVVVVALGRVVHDRVVARDDAVQQPGVADVAHDELHAVGGQPRDVLGVAGVGKLVQDGHVHAGVVVDHVVHEVAADEAAAARDDDVPGLEELFRHICISHWIGLVLARAVDDLAGGDLLQVPAVDRLAVGLRGPLQLGGRDPAVLPGDLLGDRDRQVLGVLHGADELRGLVQALHGAGVQPRVAAAEGDHGQRPLLQVHPVEVGDLQLASGGGLHPMGLGGHVARVEVESGDGVGALGALGLLLDGDGPALPVELHDAEALGVVHVVAEDRGAARLGVLHGARQVARQAVAVEDVVAQHQRARLAGDELLADGEGLRQAVRTRLLCVGEVHAVARAVPEQALEVGQVGRRGDDQDVPDARQHEGGQRVVDHGLVVDRQQLLGGHERERVQARAGPAGEDDAFHSITSKVSERKNKSV